MKRMKKKVVAMVTLAMFMMTLLPMAAFAAPVKSEVSVNKDSEEITIDAATDKATATIDLDFSDADKAKNVPVYVWLTKDDSDKIYRYANFTDASPNKSNGELKDAAKLSYDAVKSQKTLTVELSEAGVYTLHAGLAYAQGDYTDRGQLGELDATGTITVTAADTYVDSVKVTSPTPVEGTDAENSGTVEFKKDNTWLVPNGYNKISVIAEVNVKYSENNKEASSVGQKVAIEAPSNFTIKDADDNAITEATVKSGKTVSFDVVPDATVGDGYYIIKLTAGDKSYDLTVKVGNPDTTVKTLEAVDTTTDVYGIDGTETQSEATLESVAKFAAKDANGNLVSGWNASDATVVVEKQPKKTLETGDVSVKETDEDGIYTLEVSDERDLVVGDYSVVVYLNNERSNVKLNFSVKKFDKAVDIVFGDVTSADNTTGDNSVKLTDDKIVFGQVISGNVLYVDKNGVTKPADKATIGIDGPAVDKEAKEPSSANFVLDTMAPDYRFVTTTVDGDRDAAIGSQVKVTVYDNTVKKSIEKVFTVVDGSTANTLAFSEDTGKVNTNNPVKVKVVDENGALVKVNGDLGYYVATNSNKDANIYVAGTGSSEVVNGVADITVHSDKATVAEIVFYVKSGDKVYGNTLKYTFGEQDVPANTSVVMTLGSTEMVINNNIVDMKDAAPFAQNNRTFVPFRALGEALGAQVDYVEADKTVHYVLGNTEIVMTLDSKDYTVNGEKKTMDVAPFAKDNRTYVPVRFVGEALGFKVDALQNAAGQYVTVVFTK